MNITWTVSGSDKKTSDYLKNITKGDYLKNLDKYGKIGVQALYEATPKLTGKTASSWDYIINKTKAGVSITWTNDNFIDRVPIAVILQYGHGTRNGGYVQGIDYINPALKPVFEQIAEDAWKEVVSK